MALLLFQNKRLRFLFFFDDEDDEPNGRCQRNLNYLDKTNYFLTSFEFRQSFRVDVEVFNQIEYMLGHGLNQFQRRNRDNSVSLSVREQILTALHFLGNGAQYHLNGQTHSISKATVCRCVHRVCYLIAVHLMPIFVKFPSNCRLIERQFYQKAGFPHVRGAIDGTLIYVDAPSQDEPIYVGRNNKHSINVLLVSGPNNEFYYVSAKSPGSFHDARALRISSLWQQWELRQWRPDGDANALLLGDSAYPLTMWLMPPVIRDANANIRVLAQAVPAYLAAHRKTRFIVECSIGILKEEYPALNHIRFQSVERICTAVYACVTLHNMQNKFRRGSYDYDPTLQEITNRGIESIPIDEDDNDDINGSGFSQAGIVRQRQILQEFAAIL